MSTYEISKSSLLSLKAEILRKQQELGKVKAHNEAKIRNIKKNSPLDLKNKNSDQKQSKPLNEEEENLLKKSKEILEAKSKLYNKLSRNPKNLTEDEIELNRRYLVRFDKKKSSDLPPESDEDDVDKYPDENEINSKSEYPAAKSPDEEWVEYIDCLGRTRTCLRKDLNYLKSKDQDLKSTIGEGKLQTTLDRAPSPIIVDNTEKSAEESELLSNDMRREMLRKQWEKEEEELRDKSDIHYQDILFNEARTHGVGYYGFSKDEEERAKQQEALKNLRQETKQQQEKAKELKAMREKQLAARIKAAKNRKRARLGLPPEENEPESAAEPNEEVKIDEEKKEASKEQAEKEKILDVARKSHIRPWDIGKEKLLKKHYEYSQEEWVDKKRRERPSEFAPPSAKRKDFRSVVESNIDEADSYKSLRFSTKKSDEKDYQKNRKYVNPYKTDDIKDTPQFKPTPIRNEIDNSDDEQKKKLTDDRDGDKRRGRGAEIAPPPTFDYYGRESKKSKRMRESSCDIEDSIEAGLKYLRQQIEKKESTSSRHSKDFY